MAGPCPVRCVASRRGGGRAGSPAWEENPSGVIVRLEVANAELRAQNVKLSREREPFQQTAKYFAGEANRRRPLSVRRGPLGQL